MDEMFGARVLVARVAWRMTANAEPRYRRVETVSAPRGLVLEEPEWQVVEPETVERGCQYRFTIPKSQRFMVTWAYAPGEVHECWPGLPLPGSDEKLPKLGGDGIARVRRLEHVGGLEFRTGVVVGRVKRTEGTVWPGQASGYYGDDWSTGGASAERVVDLFVVALAPPRLRDGPHLYYVAPEDMTDDSRF